MVYETFYSGKVNEIGGVFICQEMQGQKAEAVSTM